MLQRVRDETHRFATTRNQKLRTKENTVSIFTKIPGIAEKRARTLTKTFTTLENLVFAQTAQITQAINVSLDEAKSIQLEAKKLLKEQNLKKEQQKQSLKSYGTTPEAAAKEQYISDLASQALAVADSGSDSNSSD